MSPRARRAALVVFLVGALGVWLIAPIGNACPDIGKLPAGSRSSSAPSFSPPFTRTCTYTAAGGIEAHQRYVPIVDWIVLAVLAGVVGLGITLLGGPRPPAPPPATGPEPAPRARPAPRPAPASSPEGEPDAAARAARRELERQQRARRRGR